jgi:hypothetical protein
MIPRSGIQPIKSPTVMYIESKIFYPDVHAVHAVLPQPERWSIRYDTAVRIFA